MDCLIIYFYAPCILDLDLVFEFDSYCLAGSIRFELISNDFLADPFSIIIVELFLAEVFISDTLALFLSREPLSIVTVAALDLLFSVAVLIHISAKLLESVHASSS